MLESQLQQQLTPVAQRIGRLWMWQQLTWSWIALSLCAIGWMLAGRPLLPGFGWFVAAMLVSALVWTLSQIRPASRTEIARRIEQAFPELNSRLLAALEQTPEVSTGRLNVLQRQVIAEAVNHAQTHEWNHAISPRQMSRAIMGQSMALASFVVIGLLGMQATLKSVAAVPNPLAASPSFVAKEFPVIVEPGDAELERGSSLLVLARFTGTPPADVHVVWSGSGKADNRLSLTKSLDDPVFATRLPIVKENLVYHIEFDGRQTPDYRITVYDLPALERADLHFQYPEYTHLPPATVEDAFEASVVEGTQVRIVCRVNKPVVTARLVAANGPALDLQLDSVSANTCAILLTPTTRSRWKLELVDDAGRKNRDPEDFRIDVVPNRVPDLKLTFPAKDIKVSPLEEVVIEATVVDDFGLLETGLVVQIPGRDPITVPLGQDLSGGQQHKLSSIQRLEEFRVQPDELMTYYLYADDFGPNGERRRTSGDVYFAEIRAFDEIYRQVDQQGAGEMQNSQKPPESLAKLLELQKQIIVSSWKLARLADPSWSPKVAEQVTAISESQTQGLQKLQGLREKMTQPQLQPIFGTVKEEMQKGAQQLAELIQGQSLQGLTTAITAEQMAYQGLLKLRAKEHMLMQSKAKGNGQQNEEKEKLDLELKQQKDRYESEKTAAKKEEGNVNREALAVLDRLKEMSRRQEEINQQLKELDAEMRQAKTDAEKNEVERRLKRLREEQQQLLHDTDELRNKLNKSTQQEMVAETKNQLEQTRQRMVETAEKLREGQVSQALSAGTRAERELKQMQEDFRKQTAAQFADAMRSMRDEVRQLADREQQLADQLAQMGDETRRSLRQSQERAELQAEFQQQQQQANQIMNEAKQVVQQAETAEPLLSKQLYDMLRTTRAAKLDQSLTATQQLLKQGVLPEAAKAEQQARSGINQLKQGIERAAESVLGNEVDSLKRARKELAQLSQQLDDEIRANAKGAGASSNRPDSNSPPTNSPPTNSPPTNSPPNGTEKNTGQPGEAPVPGKAPGPGNPSETAAAGEPGAAPGESAEKGKEPSAGPGLGQGGDGPPGDGPPGGNGEGEASPAGPPAPGANPNENENAAGNKPPTLRRGAGGLRPSKSPASPGPRTGREQPGAENSDHGDSAGNGQGGGPITTGNYAEFHERLRDVESMISDPRLQADVQKVRDRARSARAEFKRHTNTPNWEVIRTSVHQPMIELQNRLADEIAKHESPDSLVPVDRDPVPTRYRDLVRGYYEKLGSGTNDE